MNKILLDEDKHKYNKQPFIFKEYLSNINLDDSFFDSLKSDYKGFEEWYIKKSEEGKTAYITKKDDKISAFLMLKTEYEDEDYQKMHKPLLPKKRLKVSTMKVDDKGKRIGEEFLKIIINEAHKETVDEIYATVFKKQTKLIDMLLDNGFKEYTYKFTEKQDGTKEKEYVYVKSMEVDEHV